MVTRFGILGPVEVEGESGPIAIRGAKRRALLIRLLLSANQPVTLDTLADDIWDGGLGEGTVSTVSSHVSLLRKLIGADRIANHAGSYCLTVGPGELDAAEFEAEVVAGRHAYRESDFGAAADRFERSLACWRGRALADVEGAPWALGAIARLDELRFGAEESLLDARMALGLHRDVVSSAEAAAEAQPLREHRWATLMLALYRSGRQADALRAYQRLRSLLGEELGLEPSTELADLEDAIIRHSPELDVVHAAPTPAPGARAFTAPAPVPVPSRVADSETVILLFTDWVNSTAVSTSMDVDEADTLRRTHFALLRDVLTQHEGNEVKNLGDGLMAVFSSPSAALAAAAAMQQGVERLNRRAEVVLGLRVGLSAGEVALDDGDYFGDPVVEAARLCNLAQSGQVLVASLVRAMAGRRSRLRFTDAGELELKGIPDPVPALSLEWESLAEEAPVIPMPEALRVEGPGFFGRASEQAQIAALFEQAANGERQFAFVGGEPGIGKTTLTSVIARTVGASGGTVLYGRCLEQVNAPYQPFVQALDDYVHHAPQELLEDHVAEFGGELLRLVPSLARRVPGVPAPSQSDPNTERYLTFGAVLGLLTGESTSRPVFLVLDDLHWAEASTLQLLRHLALASPRLPLLILGTFRSNEVSGDHPLVETLAALWRERGVTRVELSGLSAPEVFDLCAAAAGHAVDDAASSEFVRALQRDTDGNPYFVWELLRHLAESGGLVQDAAERWSPDQALLRTGLPASVHEVITQRVRHLGPDAARVLSLAAVIGPDFDLATLGTVAETSQDVLLDLIETAERAALVEPSGDGDRYVFAHALLRHTLYDTLPSSRKRLVHAKVARALEDGPGGPPPAALLAHHFLVAGERSAALHYAELAGRDALGSMAPGEALRWFDEALTLLTALQPDGDQRRCDLTTQKGIAQRQAGDPAYRETLLEAVALADAAGDARRMARAALANTRGYYSSVGETDHERVAALRAALERLGAADGALRLRLLATLSSELVFEAAPAERRALVRQIKEEVHELNDPVVFVDVHNLLVNSSRHPTNLEERLEDSAEVLRLAEDLGDRATLFWAIGHRMRATLEAGRVAEARELFERMSSVADELSQPFMRWMTAFSRAQWAFLAGDTHTGEQLAEEALNQGLAIGQPDALIIYMGQLTHARWQHGRLSEIVDQLEEGALNTPNIPAYKAVLVRALCQAGREQEAITLLDEAAGRRFVDMPDDPLWSFGLVVYAEASIVLAHTGSAALLYEMLAPFERMLVMTGPTCEGPIAHYLGGLAGVNGQLSLAEQHFEVAATMAGDTGSPYFSARTLIERGRVAAGGHDLAAARRYLVAGRDLAVQWRFADEVRKADQALLALG